MTRYFIRTDNAAYTIDGDEMFIDGDHLYIYFDKVLCGMFKTENVIDAHIATKKEAAP